MTNTEIKDIVKEAITEVLESKPELLEKALLNAIEDIGLIKAMNEGEKGDYVNFDKFMNDLNSRVDSGN